MKRVLIVTYYWVPSGGAGVQRWVKFTKYLRDFGWEPVIYTPLNPEFPSIDTSFEKDLPADLTVIKTPIWEPYQLYRRLFGKKGQSINAGFISEDKPSGWKERLSIAIRGNLLIPDPRRFWIKPSVRFLSSYLKQCPVDAVITTGPPHSMHLIGMGLKKLFPQLPWLADFRDPWTNIDFYKELRVTPLADALHQRMELKVVRQADVMLVVSNGMKEEYAEMQPRRIEVITNGFDSDDVDLSQVTLDKRFTVSHIGTLNAARNPKSVWAAMRQLCDEDSEFRKHLVIQLIGKVDYSVLSTIREMGLIDHLLKIDYLSHHDAIRKQQSSQVLLLLINNSANAKGILTGKFFEYLASGRPVLGVGPEDGDAADMLRDTGAGSMCDFLNVAATKKELEKYFRAYQQGKLQVNAASVEQFSRKSLTGKLIKVLDQLTSHA